MTGRASRFLLCASGAVAIGVDGSAVHPSGRVKGNAGTAPLSGVAIDPAALANSKNCVAGMIVYGTPDSLMSFSCAILARMQGLSDRRSVPVFDEAGSRFLRPVHNEIAPAGHAVVELQCKKVAGFLKVVAEKY